MWAALVLGLGLLYVAIAPRSGSNPTKTSGVAMLEPGSRYRVVLEFPASESEASAVQALGRQLASSLAPEGASNVAVVPLEGRTQVIIDITPVGAQAVPIGPLPFGEGRIARVIRLDGKGWDS